MARPSVGTLRRIFATRTVVISVVFLIALVIIIFAPTDCIAVKFFNTGVTKCKALGNPSYPSDEEKRPAVATPGPSLVPPSPNAHHHDNITGTWVLNGNSRGFPVSGYATFSNGSQYEFSTNQGSEFGTYTLGAKNLTLASISGDSLAFRIKGFEHNAFNLVSPDLDQHYRLEQISQSVMVLVSKPD